MADVENMDDPSVVVDAVNYSVSTSPCTVAAGKGTEQGLTNAVGIDSKGAVAEFEHGRSDGFRESVCDRFSG
jgi:hypothetical protein